MKVYTHRGVVQLSGFVDTEAEQAERIATRVAGVERVENRIELKPEQLTGACQAAGPHPDCGGT